METIYKNWFVCKIRYVKIQADGREKSVTEPYVVNALSFTEAEARITEEISPFISGDFEVEDISRAAFREVIHMGYADESRYYKAKVQFITINEKTGYESKSHVIFLVEGKSLENARENIDNTMCSSLSDYSIVSVAETKIIEVFSK